MVQEIRLTEIKEDGFEDAILKLRELGRDTVITPWETYNIVDKEVEECSEKFFIDLRGMAVGVGGGQVVAKALIQIDYRDAAKTEVKESKISIVEDNSEMADEGK